ncbi:phosphatase [Jeongeupia sp. HS-3]|uniref:PhoX family protein n=1 Tax=Jeongeupia sp. HS-3 TaxID=1009682 RepID=UPI0018A539DE|nr:PhoX family phosphatase [Jeongeupia sp. HS-3]BCL74815.1 phosphatase [Jeongeupia sp. HS-3]
MKEQNNTQISNIDADDIGHNDSDNGSFENVLESRISRRGILRGGLGGAAAMMFGGVALGGALSACGGGSTDNTTGNQTPGPTPAPTPGPVPAPTPTPTTPPAARFNFNPVAKNMLDALTLPAGYSATVLYALGDPINTTTAAYKNDGSDDAASFDFRAGDHHDGMNYFGLNAAGTARDLNGSERGLIAMNHENITDAFLHVAGATTTAGVRPAAEVDKEIRAHGVAVIEVQKTAGKFQLNRSSVYNRRITAQTPMDLYGPVRGSDQVKTLYSTDGTKSRGTVNNCATGDTPWGTFLTCEENWAGYFSRTGDVLASRSANELASFGRYGVPSGASGKKWDTAGAADVYKRWNLANSGASALADYRNEANTFGYVVEIDPYAASSTPRKRTHLGRFAHECAVYAPVVAGKPVVFYMGDDSRNEYIYKYVSKAVWDSADATKGLAAGDKYLDEGTLYVAKFNADGSGTWLPLTLANTAISGYAGFAFASLADICIHTRIAADAAGATKMDRPEWCSVNPKNGEVYYTLTNNSNRVTTAASGSKILPDAANPRAYEDMKGASKQTGNVNGHIIRTAEAGADAAATSFKWDVYVFAAEAKAGAAVNLSALTDDNDMSSPDGIWFSPKSGLLWIQTDDGAYSDVTNCMMLAAIPGKIGDGGATKVANTIGAATLEVSTHKGKNPDGESLRRFLVGPKDCEITGVAETPDGKTLFVNIQHPGEDTKVADLADPSKFTSHWPDGGNARPRSATIVITKNDGGTIGI